MTIVIDRIARVLLKPWVENTRKKYAWHPSSASVQFINSHKETVTAGSCMRRQYYAYTGEPETGKSDLSGTLKMRAGDLWSDFIAEQIKIAGFYYGDEVSFYNEQLNVSGRVDFIVAEEGTGYPVGVEMKTTGGFLTPGVIKPTARKPLAPKIDHVLQCMIYLYHYRKTIKKWVLLYMDRDGFTMCEHIIRLEHDEYYYPVISNEMGTQEWKHITLENIIQRWQALSQHIKDKILPDRDYEIQYTNKRIHDMCTRGELPKTKTTKVASAIKRLKGKPLDEAPPILVEGDWQCRYCPYAEACYKAPATTISKEEADAP